MLSKIGHMGKGGNMMEVHGLQMLKGCSKIHLKIVIKFNKKGRVKEGGLGKIIILRLVE
jgi:hypothetical protein